MEGGIVLFFIIIFIPGLWLVFNFRREIKQRLWFEERRLMEQERAIRASARRYFAPGHARLPVDIAPPAPPISGAERVEKSISTDSSSVQLESWQDLTASNMGAAFEIFLRETAHPSEWIMTSQIDEAFEKFLSYRVQEKESLKI